MENLKEVLTEKLLELEHEQALELIKVSVYEVIEELIIDRVNKMDDKQLIELTKDLL